MIKLIMFFVILEGFQTDSAKSSLGFLDDLSEGHLLFFNFEKNSKSDFQQFSKTYSMLRFLEKYYKLPLGFHFSEDHFPLGGRIFSRSKFLSVNCIIKIIQFGGQSEKSD